MFNGVCGVGIPYKVDVELEPGIGAVLDTLRSHSESRLFLMYELWKLDSRCDFRNSLTSPKVPGNAKVVIVEVGKGTFSCLLESLTRKDG